MLFVLFTNVLLFEDSKEVIAFHERHDNLLFVLDLNGLLKDDILEELLCCLLIVQQVDHEHHHDFNRFLIEFTNVELAHIRHLFVYHLLERSLGYLRIVVINIIPRFVSILFEEAYVFHNLQELLHYDISFNFTFSQYLQEVLHLLLAQVIDTECSDTF